MSRLDFTVASKHCVQLAFVGACGEALHVQVRELGLGAGLNPLFALLVGEDLNLLATKHCHAILSDSFLGFLSLLEKDVSETTALTIGVELKFAGADFTDGREVVENLLLGDFGTQVTHDDVGLGVELLVGLDTQVELGSGDGHVVHLFLAPLSFFLGVELEESVAESLLGDFVGGDSRTAKFEAAGREALEEIKIVEVLGEVANVDRGALDSGNVGSVSAGGLTRWLRREEVLEDGLGLGHGATNATHRGEPRHALLGHAKAGGLGLSLRDGHGDGHGLLLVLHRKRLLGEVLTHYWKGEGGRLLGAAKLK